MRIIHFSIFNSARDNTPKPMGMTWPELVAYLQIPRKPLPVPAGDDPKKGMPAICPAVFKPGTNRAVENVFELNLLCLDFDNAISVPTGEFHLDKLGNSTGRPKMKKVVIPDPVRISDIGDVLQLSGIDHFLHPTWSDSPSWPHFRLIVPLAQGVPPKWWDLATGWSINHFGLEPFLRGVDMPVLKDVARIYFLPGGPNAR